MPLVTPPSMKALLSAFSTTHTVNTVSISFFGIQLPVKCTPGPLLRRLLAPQQHFDELTRDCMRIEDSLTTPIAALSKVGIDWFPDLPALWHEDVVRNLK